MSKGTKTLTRKRPSTARRWPSGWSRVALVAVVIAVPLGALALLSGPSGDAPTPNGRAGGAGTVSIAHVHGLGVNPADASLYVATHTGTFRIPEAGPAERVGESYQDTMGFTVAGPDRFLGSGHPDVPSLRAGEPPLLGLIESTDAGQSWVPRSLRGQADFHGLAFAHGRVYGLDSTSGRFMVSSDLANWEVRSTVELFSFAVDPADPEHVVGASPRGLLESTDGGRQWAPVTSPGLVALSWEPGIGLWGVEPDGSLHQRRDAGQTWEEAGSLPGQPEAFLAADGVLYAAVLDGDVTGIYRSDDEGGTWGLLYRDEA